MACVTESSAAVQSPPKTAESHRRATTWNVVRTLGEGAFGEVKLVVDSRNLKFAVAVKCIDLVHNKGAIEIVRKEALLQRRLRGHKNIVQYIGMRMEGIEEFQIFLEYVDGGELFDKIEPDIGMPITKAQFYFLQLIGGVKHMHSLGIAHRDIKPENILITQNDVLKISDFGMATIFRHEGKERYLSTRCGTLPYVSPQVIDGCYRGEPSDIWSCGVVLVAMLAGELPWETPERANSSYRSWTENKILCEHPWKKIENLALGLLRSVLCEDEDSRASLERIEKHPWCSADFTGYKGCLNEFGTSDSRLSNDAAAKPRRCALDIIQESCSSDSYSQPATLHQRKPYNIEFPYNREKSAASFSQPVDMEALLLNYSQIDSQTLCGNPLQLLVKRMTRFCVSVGLYQILDMIVAAAEACGFEIKTISDYHITIQTRSCIFIVTIYNMGVATGGQVMVDFRRSRGDGIDFKRAFIELKKKLSPVICKQEANWLEDKGPDYSEPKEQTAA